MPNPATAHAAHDELLIARLFGDDVDQRERAAALEQMAACDECADVFADMGSIRSATAALPTPSRPRDFSLTPADAARLRPARHGLGRVFGRGLRRSFGGSLAALGLTGLLLTTAVSAVPGMSGIASTALDTGNKSVPEAAGSANDYANAGASPALVVNGGDVTTDGGQSPAIPAATTGGAQSAATALSTPGGGLLPVETARAAATSQVAGGAADSPAATSQPNPAPALPGSSSGLDGRTIAFAAFGLALALGLLLLIVPALLRRRARG
jgi:hypothetical protein